MDQLPATKLAVLIAIAKQIPCAGRIIAVLTPMTRPRASTSGPPELPGLSAASVWMTLSIRRPGLRAQRAAERADDARGDRALEAVRVADRDGELADAQRRESPNVDRRSSAASIADDGEVGVGIVARPGAPGSCGRRAA